MLKKSLSLKFLKVNRGDVAAYAATSPRLTLKNFKLRDILKFSDFNEAPTNSLMMIYVLRSKHVGVFLSVLKLTF